MGKIQVRVKTGFGEVVVEGESVEEVLGLLGSMSSEFMGKVSGLVSAKMVSPLKTRLEGIIELTTEGPILATREKLTHYEAIGLTLYASEEKSNTLVFKPDPGRPEFRLTTQGERWIEDEVLAKLQGARG